MFLTTTDTVEGHRILRYLGIVGGANAVVGVSIDHEAQPNTRTVLAYGTAVYLVPLDEAGSELR